MSHFTKVLTVATSVAVLSDHVHADSFYKIDEDHVERLQRSMDLSIDDNSFVTIAKNSGLSWTKSKMVQASEAEIEKPKKVHALAPVIQKVNGQSILDESFKKNVKTYAEMTDLTYRLVKAPGNDEQLKYSTKQLEDFTKAGWKISFFDGLSGNDYFDHTKYDGKNNDLAGLVAFNPETGEAVVAFHGSQDANDWGNNFQAYSTDARAHGFNFDGNVHGGFSSRYRSSKDTIYALLKRSYEGLDAEGKDKFHVTTTGHSLGGGVAALAYADLSTDFAKQLWGDSYTNAAGNRIRSFAISAPRAFDKVAVENLEKKAGIHNILLDTNGMDPVGRVGLDQNVTKAIDFLYNYTPLSYVWSGLKYIGVSDTYNLKTYANFKQLGTKAYQSTGTTVLKAMDLQSKLDLSKQGFFSKWISKITNGITVVPASLHYMTTREDGMGFDPRLIDPETLEDRLNGGKAPTVTTTVETALQEPDVVKTDVAVLDVKKPEVKKSFWSKLKAKVFAR